MTEIAILSFIQGISEFLPISSSGHLILMPTLFGWQDHSLEIDGMLHFGTLCAVLCYFFKDIKEMTEAFFRFYIFKGWKERANKTQKKERSLARLSLTLVVATLPVVLAGLVLKRLGIEMVRAPLVIGIMGIMGGILLYACDKIGGQNRTLDQLSMKDSLWIGMIQCLALLPGASRSGMCITGGRLLGFHRKDSIKYAFLLSIPAVFGAFCLIFFDAYRDGLQTPLKDLFLGFILSFLFGLAAIHLMLKYISRHSFFIFMIYRIILGSLALWFI